MTPTPARVLVCGGRDYPHRTHVMNVLDDVREACGVAVVIHGGAPGADAHAAAWAQARGVPSLTFAVTPAAWEAQGAKAGPLRNRRMLDEGQPTLVIAFPGGRGTDDMVRQASRRNVPIVKLSAHARWT